MEPVDFECAVPHSSEMDLAEIETRILHLIEQDADAVYKLEKLLAKIRVRLIVERRLN